MFSEHERQGAQHELGEKHEYYQAEILKNTGRVNILFSFLRGNLYSSLSFSKKPSNYFNIDLSHKPGENEHWKRKKTLYSM